MKKVLVGYLLSLVLVVSFLVGCASNAVRYNLSAVNFANVTVDYYEYNYIDFDFENHTYKLENKAKQVGLVVTQKGTFTVDENNFVTITNDDIPTLNYLLYTGETLYFDGDVFHVEAYIPGYGQCSMAFSK